MVRKTHTKSRRGCVPCKRRHVKCDEQRPKCAHCVRLDIDCTWPPRTVNVPFSPGSEVATSPTATPTAGPTRAAGDLDIPHLRLLHFWVMHTSATMGVKPQHYVYQSSFVELGFRHPFLMHGILAVAAVHRAAVCPAECEDLCVQSSAHMEIAINALRIQLARPDPSTSPAVFALAALVVVHSLGMAQVQLPSQPIREICHWMRLIKGVQTTATQNWGRLLTSEVAPIITGIDRVRRSVSGGGITEVLELKSLIELAVDAESPFKTAYLQAIDELHSVYEHVHYFLSTGEVFSVQITLSWTALIDPVILDLLEERDPLALLLLAYFAVLFKLQENTSWWMRGWALRTIASIKEHLGTKYSEYMKWPTDRVNGS